jgi:hypothetical protein
VKRILIGFFFVALLLITPVSAFDLQQVYISIDNSGDALVTANYQENPAEYIGIKTAAGTPVLLDRVKSITHREVSPVCSGYGVTTIVVKGFAEVNGDRFSTPSVDLSENTIANQIGSVVPLDLKTDVTIIFPDGYSEKRSGVTTIPAVSHTVGQKHYQAPQPAQQCKSKKDLPLSGILPDELTPVAAVGAGVAITALGLSTFGSLFSSWLSHLVAFLQNMIGGMFAGRVADKDKERRAARIQIPSRKYLGFTRAEIAVFISGAVLIGVLFFFAARNPFDPTLLAIYIFMGGFALIAHEVAHWYLAKKYHSHTEVQFWGLGTVIMMITAWLFGNVFAQPTLTVVRSEVPLEKRPLGLIMLSGPLLSILIAFACLLLIPLGGLFKTAGILGFSINLLTGVYELLPITPCEGKDVFGWNRVLWIVLFIPFILLYMVVNV